MDTPDKLVWAQFYSAIVGWQFHPANGMQPHDTYEYLDEYADLATAMWRRYKERIDGLDSSTHARP